MCRYVINLPKEDLNDSLQLKWWLVITSFFECVAILMYIVGLHALVANAHASPRNSLVGVVWVITAMYISKFDCQPSFIYIYCHAVVCNHYHSNLCEVSASLVVTA